MRPNVDAARQRVEARANELLGEAGVREKPKRKGKADVVIAPERAAPAQAVLFVDVPIGTKTVTSQRRQPKAGTLTHAWCKPCAPSTHGAARLSPQWSCITCKTCRLWLSRRPLAMNEALAADREAM